MNWGAPFVAVCIALLMMSGVSLSLGYPDFANDIAIYAFYSLLLGVALQIVSYVKYGEEKPPIDEGPVPMETEKRFVSPLGLKLAVVFVAVVILIGGVAILQFSGATSNVLPTLPHLRRSDPPATRSQSASAISSMAPMAGPR